MVYLDYSATTPVLFDVLESYNKVTKEYLGNANSLHKLGINSKKLLESATLQISELFKVNYKEITYTSGATESNNMALKGIADFYEGRGKHIIVSKLEHPSIYAICEYLQSKGYEISKVNNDKDGLIDLEELKKLIRKDTILVSICGVNSEMGIRQPLKTIRQVIKKANPNTFFHSDLTQAIGKIAVNLSDVDLASMSSHKVYGPKGIGILYKKEHIEITPLISGTTNIDKLRPGTVPLPLIVALSKALRIALIDIDKKTDSVKKLNEKICLTLEELDGVLINKTNYSIPHILNVSLSNIRPETFIHALENHEIYIGTNTACSSGDISASILAVYNDKKRALSSVRISISHITTANEITRFLDAFAMEYNHLKDL